MTYLEIVQEVFRIAESNVQAVPVTSVVGNTQASIIRVVNWVAQANRRRQRMRLWDFRRLYGLIHTSVAGTGDFTLYGDYEGAVEFDPEDFSIRRSTNEVKVPLGFCPYENWTRAYMDQYDQLGQGWPFAITQLPDKTWRLTPVPDREYLVYGTVYAAPIELEYNEDEPPWDSDLHEILVWDTLQYFAEEYEHAPLRERIRLNAPELERLFRNRYLPG